MTSVPALNFQIMDAPPDDEMEMTSSPFRNADDLDLEFEQMREPSVEPTNDNMMDDITETGDDYLEVLQRGTAAIFEEDEVSEGPEPGGDMEHFTNDLNMEEFEQFYPSAPDEKINYEEVGDKTVVRHNVEEDVDSKQDEQQQPEKIIDLDDFDDDEFVQNFEEDDLTNNNIGGEHENPQDPTDDAGEAAHNPDDKSRDQKTSMDPVHLPYNDNNATADLDEEEDESTLEEGTVVQESDPTELEPPPVEHEPSTDVVDDLLVTTLTTNPEQLHSDEPVADLENGGGIEPTRNSTTNAPAENPSDIHAVKVAYLGEEMFLFPPSQAEELATFFLSDTGLAFEPLDKLLEACRGILTGSIGHDDELVMEVPFLGLHVCEDSKYAAQISLAQVLDLYMTLNHNENAQSIEPLNCNLSTRVCLASQYAYLSAAALEGKTYSEIAADYVDTPAEDVDLLEPSAQLAEESLQNPRLLSEAVADQVAEHVKGEEAHDELTEVGTAHVGLSGVVETLVGDDSVEREDSTSTVQHRPEDPEQVHHPREVSGESAESGLIDQHNLQPAISAEGSTEPGVIDEPEVSHQAETVSALTIQAGSEAPPDTEEMKASEHVEDSFLDEEDEVFEHGEDIKRHQTGADHNDIEPQLPVEHEPYSDEELISAPDGKDDVNQTQTENGDFEVTQTGQAPSSDVTVNGQALASAVSNPNGSHPTKAQPPFDLTEPTPPVTPSKTRTTKRKAVEEDDEFDFLDNDTPDPKRRRPS